jgi:hypothetical protein
VFNRPEGIPELEDVLEGIDNNEVGTGLLVKVVDNEDGKPIN